MCVEVLHEHSFLPKLKQFCLFLSLCGSLWLFKLFKLNCCLFSQVCNMMELWATQFIDWDFYWKNYCPACIHMLVSLKMGCWWKNGTLSTSIIRTARENIQTAREKQWKYKWWEDFFTEELWQPWWISRACTWACDSLISSYQLPTPFPVLYILPRLSLFLSLSVLF